MCFDRRDFIRGAAASAALGAAGCLSGTADKGASCVASGSQAATAAPANLTWAALLKFGANICDDAPGMFDEMPRDAATAEAHPIIGPGGKPIRCRNYLRFDEAVWKRRTDEFVRNGGNMVLIDMGEAMKFPSHPELAVSGSWSPDRVKAELARLRKMGLEPIPKLNFSTTHDAWLKEYGRMIATKPYYEVCRDVIRDTLEVFGSPRYFHLGCDEETAGMQWNTHYVVCRQRDLWWHDFQFLVGEVERGGARAMIWSDYLWGHHDEFLKRMPKSVLQCNWYYRADFSPKRLQWDAAAEKRHDKDIEVALGAVAFLELEKAGYDQLPCTSNYFCDESANAVVKFCKEHIDPSRLKGFMVAPWQITESAHEDKIAKGLCQLTDAKKVYYP